ncbi:MAG: hypothetical protein DCF32_04550 [Leptolyngbya sp.]|nr:MAG: hypothetical protein DCF32_04550 [Leptolyngbya sp.]
MSKQCARLIAIAVIYYNTTILLRLLTKYEVSGHAKALSIIKRISDTSIGWARRLCHEGVSFIQEFTSPLSLEPSTHLFSTQFFLTLRRTLRAWAS